MLNMSVENIRKLVGQEITYENWIHSFTTNCYAFAMGFDVSEEDICYHAYGLGYISSNILGTKPWKFRTVKGAERQLLYDFKDVNEWHPSNIPVIYTTFFVLKLSTFISFKLPQ